MKIRLLVSHPFNNRPKVRMAKVGGCTFFLKREKTTVGRETVVGEPTWMHASSCKNVDHWQGAMQKKGKKLFSGSIVSDAQKKFAKQANAEIIALLAAK